MASWNPGADKLRPQSGEAAASEPPTLRVRRGGARLRPFPWRRGIRAQTSFAPRAAKPRPADHQRYVFVGAELASALSHGVVESGRRQAAPPERRSRDLRTTNATCS